ncbi:MAG: hypothetical protein WC632_02725 [Candidatus Margulisiibacteriota bacterium]
MLRTIVGAGLVAAGLLNCGGKVIGNNENIVQLPEDAGLPDIHVPDNHVPDAVIPDVNKPDVTPDIHIPDAPFDINLPDVQPDIMPDVQPDTKPHVCGPGEVPLAADPADPLARQLMPALASNGQAYAATWIDMRNNVFSNRFRPFTVLGETNKETEFQGSFSMNTFVASSLAWDGEKFGVVWGNEGMDLSFFSVSQTGEKLDQGQKLFTLQFGDNNPSLAWSEACGCYGLLWNDREFGPDGGLSTPEIYFLRLAKSGKPLGEKINITNNEEYSYNRTGTSIAATTAGFAITWTDYALPISANTGIYAKMITKEGVPIEPKILIASGLNIHPLLPPHYGIGTMPAIASAGDKSAIVWSKKIAWDHSELHLTGLSGNGQITKDVTITDSAAGNLDPSIVWSPERQEFGLVWVAASGPQDNSGLRSVLFTRVSQDLTLIGSPQTVAQTDGNFYYDPPQIASTADGYALAYGSQSIQSGSKYYQSYFNFVYCAGGDK